MLCKFQSSLSSYSNILSRRFLLSCGGTKPQLVAGLFHVKCLRIGFLIWLLISTQLLMAPQVAILAETLPTVAALKRENVIVHKQVVYKAANL
jgi:hypothetical protein